MPQCYENALAHWQHGKSEKINCLSQHVGSSFLPGVGTFCSSETQVFTGVCRPNKAEHPFLKFKFKTNLSSTHVGATNGEIEN